MEERTQYQVTRPRGDWRGRTHRSGPRPLEPRIHARDLGRKGPISPFTRLARTHLFSVAGDGLFAIGMAGTVFFNADPGVARGKVALYLLLTLAPFAVASPLIGPLLDRASGGRRWMIFGAALARAFVAFLLLRDLDNLGFYLEAFLLLVLSKVHLISKSALLPTTVRSDAELVEANAKLSLLGAIAAVVAGGPGLAFSKLFGETAGPKVVIALAMISFIGCALQAFALPDVKVAPEPPGDAERQELRGAGILHAASAIALTRFIVGFLTFMVAFSFRSAAAPNWWFLVVVVAAQGGFLSGAGLSPLLRRRFVEEKMLMIAVGTIVMASAFVLFLRDNLLLGASVMSFAVGMTSSVAKQGFDALVQRDAPDANRGRSFARFETRFQLVWVIGAFIPVIFRIPDDVGYAVIAAISAYALVMYMIGYRQVQQVAAGKRPELPYREALWRRIFNALVARRGRRKTVSGDEPSRRAGGVSSYSGSGAPVGGGGEFDEPTVVEQVPVVAGRPVTEGLFGQPDVPIPPALVATPTEGLFATSPDGAALSTDSGETRLSAAPAEETETHPVVARDCRPFPGPDGGEQIPRFDGGQPSRPGESMFELSLPFDDDDETPDYPEPRWRDSVTPPLPGFEPGGYGGDQKS
ncbi:MAG: MFS transporter [Acidimicrobiales bacterium]|nr:MFS transporter [Acidimicrobiales bacterium]